jgi:hypothetical protein
VLGDIKTRKAKFRLLGPLGQGHNIVVYIYGSPGHTAWFRNLAGKLVLMDNYIRWNSWYNMLVILIKLKKHIEDYYKRFKSELEKDLLDKTDWKKLYIIIEFL